MGTRTSYTPGTFCWTDLSTPSCEASEAFYGPLMGWEFEDVPTGGGPPYTLVLKDGQVAGGMIELADAPPAWMSYVSVEDIQASADRLRELGGSVPIEPGDAGDAGKRAIVTDRQGAHFALWQAGRRPGASIVNAPGALSLNQLNTSDTIDAQDFYTQLFGWRIEQAVTDPAPYWGIFNGESLNGGLMGLDGDEPGFSYWISIFATADLDSATATVGEAGGRIVLGPMPIQSGRIAVASDPQGAFFTLFEGQLDD